MNANNGTLTGLTTAQAGSTVAATAPYSVIDLRAAPEEVQAGADGSRRRRGDAER